MEKETYSIEAEVEAKHWWFVGRRILIAKILSALKVPHSSLVLDVGTGTGSNLRLLKRMGYEQVLGIDNNDEAIRFCREKGLGALQKGDCCNLPYKSGTFQLILATDVIEHLGDDGKALSEFHRVLNPHGTLVLTAPAFESLWGLQDEVGHHERRYRLNQLRRKLNISGLLCKDSFYFNYLLFFPIWLARQCIRICHSQIANENQVNTPLINSILRTVFTLDVNTAGILKPPFGVSILIVAQRKGTT